MRKGAKVNKINHPAIRAALDLFAVQPYLWKHSVSLPEKTCIGEMRVLVVGFLGADRSSICSQLRQIGVRSVASMAEVSKLKCVSGMASTFSHVVVNIDAFNCVDDAVGALLEFRRSTRDILIVCVSAFASMDDFGIERSAICEVTLRWPIGDVRLRAALVSSVENYLAVSKRDARLRVSSGVLAQLCELPPPKIGQ